MEGRTSHGCASYLDPEVTWPSSAPSWQDGEVRVVVAGGWGTPGHNLRTAEVFNPQSGRWRVVGDLSTPRRGITLAVT